jgi:hypothetical protein
VEARAHRLEADLGENEAGQALVEHVDAECVHAVFDLVADLVEFDSRQLGEHRVFAL